MAPDFAATMERIDSALSGVQMATVRDQMTFTLILKALKASLASRLGADVISIGPLADVREALLALGLTSTEAAQVMAGIDPEGKAPDDLLREALQKVGR